MSFLYLLQIVDKILTDCGRRAVVTSRIQGGYEVEIEEMPWMIGIGRYVSRSKLVLFCSGFIISKGFALTSAGCATNKLVLFTFE